MPRSTDRSYGFLGTPLASATFQGIDVLTGAPQEWVHYGLGEANRVGAGVMSDRLNPVYDSSVGLRRAVGPCDHITVSASNLQDFTASVNEFPFLGTSVFRFSSGAPLINLPGTTVLHDRYCPLPSVGSITDFAFKAMKEMLAIMPPEIDIASYLYELKDVPALYKSVKDVKDFLVSAGDRRVDDSIRSAASAHAGYNFGVSPLQGDTAKLFKVFGKVRKRLLWLQRHVRKWTRVGSRSQESVAEATDLDVFGPLVGDYVRVHRKSRQTKFACTAMVRQNLPWLEEWESWLQLVIMGMGLNRPLSTLWNVIPFSWAVDYFFPVSAYLESVVFQNAVNWEVRNATWSYKTNYSFDLQRMNQHGQVIGRAGTFGLKRFARATSFPPITFYVRTPSAKQLSLLAAVGISNS